MVRLWGIFLQMILDSVSGAALVFSGVSILIATAYIFTDVSLIMSFWSFYYYAGPGAMVGDLFDQTA